MSDVKLKVINRLNIVLGSDRKNLSNCKELMNKLKDERRDIEKMLSLASSEAPSKVTAAIHEVEEISKNVTRIDSEFDALRVAVRKQQEHTETMTRYIEEKVEKVEELEKLLSYLKCIHTVQSLSANLDQALAERDDNKIIVEYRSLCQFWSRLHNTHCSYLATYVKDTLHYWHNVLKERFSIQFEESFKGVKWPLLGDNNILSSTAPEAIPKFQTLVKYLLNIQLPLVTASENPALPLPITLLLRPLRKRFIYHFCGIKQTNRADKPEWFLTQVLTWIRDHEHFMNEWVQPVFVQAGLGHVSAKVELMRGLVELVIEKLHSDLPQLQFDDGLFSHTIDETLGFERELRDCFNYPESQPSAINVITQAPIFVKWIHMERKYARDKMDSMFSSETAWLPVGNKEVDDFKVTEVGEAFILLLSTMTDRYSMLPQPGHRLQFLELQLELIDDLRVRLLQLLHSERQEPLESHLPAILNTTSYLVTILNEWGMNTHFLMLQHYKNQLVTIGEEESSSVQQHSSVFDEALDLLQRLVSELLETLCEAVLLEVKAKSRPYRHDKWFAMRFDNQPSSIHPVLPSACPMFQVLVTKLHNLQSLLAVPLFNKAWQTVAAQLSNFLLEEVILHNKFNEGGAKQLHSDVTRNLIPIFRQYTEKPDSYFAIVKEACTLLTIQPFPQRWEQKLIETLPFEVHHLSPQQIQDVIQRRVEIVSDLM